MADPSLFLQLAYGVLVMASCCQELVDEVARLNKEINDIQQDRAFQQTREGTLQYTQYMYSTWRPSPEVLISCK